MGFLTRRSSAQPVEVRRPPSEPLPPVTVVVPGPVAAAPSAPAPAPAPAGSTSHVTQNFFYPPPQVPPPAPPAAAAPVYQTTVHHYHTRRPERKLSFTGTVGLVLGVLGCAAVMVPAAQPFAHWLLLGALAAGGLGLVSSALLGLTRVGVPMLAILAAAGGLVLSFRGGGSLPRLKSLRDALPTQIPTIHLQVDAPSLTSPSSPNARPSSVSPPAAPARPSSVQPPPLPAAPVHTNASLESARTTAARNLGIDYPALVAERESAAAALQQARATLQPGSPELIAANDRFLRADAALNSAREKLQSDPTVAAAAARASQNTDHSH